MLKKSEKTTPPSFKGQTAWRRPRLRRKRRGTDHSSSQPFRKHQNTQRDLRALCHLILRLIALGYTFFPHMQISGYLTNCVFSWSRNSQISRPRLLTDGVFTYLLAQSAVYHRIGRPRIFHAVDLPPHFSPPLIKGFHPLLFPTTSSNFRLPAVCATFPRRSAPTSASDVKHLLRG